MPMLSDFRIRLRAIFNRSAVERELDDELRFHLDKETEKLIALGVPPDEAVRQATIALGGVNRIKDDTRDARGVGLWDSLSQDLRYAWRGLRARPGFSAAVVFALAIGIGANATMFSIVDRLLFRTPAYLAAPDRVHRIYLTWTRQTSRQPTRIVEYIRYADLARWTSSFDRLGVIAYRTMAIGDEGDPQDMTVAAMSATMFNFFTARPALGRFYTPAEDEPPAGTPVVVLSWGFWQSHFGGDANILGQRLRIGTASFTIIGVAPIGFVGVTATRAPAVFIPVTSAAAQRTLTYHQTYGWSWLEMFAQRKEGVSPAMATADLTNAYRRSWAAFVSQRPNTPPLAQADPRAEVGSVHLERGPQASPESKVFAWVMGVSIIVLLIACANVANLLLARAITRGREVALRLALGVSRRRLIQQLATESVLLALIGGAAGVLVAYGGGILMQPALSLEGDPTSPATEWRTLGFLLGLTLFVAIATGVAPLFHAMRADINSALKAGARGVATRRSSARSGLLVLQGTLTLVLLVGAGLFVRSVWNVRTMRMGYDTDNLLYAELSSRGLRLNGQQADALARRMVEAAASTPGVTGATLAASVPFWTNEGRGAPIVAGHDSLGLKGTFLIQAGSPSYFGVTGTRIMAGRGFLESDRADAPRIAVISDRMAEVIWPGDNPIGKQFQIGSDTTPFLTVVGVAENMRARLIGESDEIWYYLPYAQYRLADPQIIVRTQGDPSRLIETVRDRLRRVMPPPSYATVTPLSTIVGNQRRSWELGAKMFVGFGLMALALAAIGLYSVIAYAVAQRMREWGVRIALGATTRDVIRLIVGQAVRFAAIGVVAGSAVAFSASRWIEPLLFRQPARDPFIFAVAAVTLLLAAILAAARPALAATRVNPSQVLQSD